MKLKQLASNMTELELNDGTIVLSSYETPVAAHSHINGFYGDNVNGRTIKTSTKWSRTTSKHITKWLTQHNLSLDAEVDQSVLDDLVK